jgi:hypothetical protein
MFNYKINLIFLLLGLLLGMQVSLFGQEATSSTPREDVVFLKNGSIIRGEIIERVIGESIKIEIIGGSVLVYEESEVEKITRAPVKYHHSPLAVRGDQAYWQVRKERRERPITGRERGIYNLFSFGFQPGRDQWNTVVPWPTLQYRTGYSFSRMVNLGLGLGLDPYAAGGTFPLYLDFHGDLGKELKAVMPHYFAQAGYGFDGWTNWSFLNFEGGPMAHLGFGWKVNTRNSTEWMFVLGYKLQAASFQDNRRWDEFGNPLEPGPRQSTVYRALTIEAVFGF